MRTFLNFFKISFQCKFLCNFIVLYKNDELLAFLSCLLFPDGGFSHWNFFLKIFDITNSRYNELFFCPFRVRYIESSLYVKVINRNQLVHWEGWPEMNRWALILESMVAYERGCWFTLHFFIRNYVLLHRQYFAWIHYY